tara:strand:+ start:2034 stop:2303 length:270 start_codon:yes stop_codon:yes gene_type:complete
VNELSDGEMFVILKPVSISIPGDERSRTNPGHGYPAHTEQHWNMEVYPTEQKWTDEIQRLMAQTGFMKKNFKAVRMIPATITTTHDVEP